MEVYTPFPQCWTRPNCAAKKTIQNCHHRNPWCFPSLDICFTIEIVSKSLARKMWSMKEKWRGKPRATRTWGLPSWRFRGRGWLFLQIVFFTLSKHDKKHQETIEIVWKRKSMKYDEILYPTWPCWYVYDYIILYIYTYYYIYTRYSYIVMRKIMIGQKDFRDGPDDDLTGQQCLEKWWDRRIDWV